MRLGNIRDANILTVVIPTAGRNTLERCLESMTPKHQAGYGIDVVVAVDMNSCKDLKYVEDLCHRYYVECLAVPNYTYSDWGYPQLEYVYKHRDENGLYLMNIGDDDVMVPGIFNRMWEILRHNPLQPHMFQAELHPSSHRDIPLGETVTLWNDGCRSLTRGHITGQNLVVPNIPHLMGKMTDDYEFMRQTIVNWDYNVSWIPLITCQCF